MHTTHKDPFKLLKEDHKKVKELFEQLLETTDRAKQKREDLFKQLKESLEKHAKIEEKFFYPRVKEEEETHELTLEAAEEHHIVKVLLPELSHLDVTAEEWLPKLKVLMENVEHHVKEEESMLFPDAKKVLDEETIDEMGDNIYEAQQK